MERTLFRVLVVSVLLVVPVAIYFFPWAVASVFGFIFFLAPLWLPFVLMGLLVPLWITYVRSQYVDSIPYSVVELKPGEGTDRNSAAMESIFYSLYHRIEVSRLMVVATGHVRLPWAFEVVANAGMVRFFMRIPTAHRPAIEARLRSEYPDIDLDEADDPTRTIPYHRGVTVESREFVFTKPDPYPIKTYDEYAKERNPEDPFLSMLEKLIQVGEGEHVILSLLVRPHQKERRRFWEEPIDTLHQDAKREIAELVGSEGVLHTLPESRRSLIAAIEGGLKKPSFDCGIRVIYAAERSAFSEDRVQFVEHLLDVFEAPERNGFRPFTTRDRFLWPLSDIASAIPAFAEWYTLQLARRRAFFAPPYYGIPFVLNTAELATLFHMPHITRAHALARSRGDRLEPPDNLPVVL